MYSPLITHFWNLYPLFGIASRVIVSAKVYVYSPGGGSVVPPKAGTRTTIASSSSAGGGGGRLGRVGIKSPGSSPSCAFAVANTRVKAIVIKRNNAAYFLIFIFFHLKFFKRFYLYMIDFLFYLSYSITIILKNNLISEKFFLLFN